MVEPNGKTVLIVDDEPATTQLLTLLLGSHGYSTQIATSTQEAMAFVSSDTDIILVDKMLPDLEGLKVCQQLKSNVKTHAIPIIVISSSHNKNEQIQSLYLGADDYLTKPFDPEELFARIDVILRRHYKVCDDNHREQKIICELKRIISQQDIRTFYQPIYFLKSRRLFGLEMFSRPQTTSTMVNPEIFFRLALHYGVYYEAEMMGWNKAIAMASRVLHEHQKLFLNCDPYLLGGQHSKNVKNLLATYAYPCANIFLEITERSAVVAYDVFAEHLKEYRVDGFKFAVDDLGAGYSSLEAIIEIKPEVVKLDRHIINGVSTDPYKRSIVKLIVVFCQENNIIFIAEGIENRSDFDCLLDLGVDAGQGYYLCRPTETLNLAAMQTLDL